MGPGELVAYATKEGSDIISLMIPCRCLMVLMLFLVRQSIVHREKMFELGLEYGVWGQSRDKMPLYFKTITAVKLHISTLCQICFQNKQPRYNL